MLRFKILITKVFDFRTEPSDCGPFRDYERTGDILSNIFLGKKRNTITLIISYINSPGVLFAVFCAIG